MPSESSPLERYSFYALVAVLVVAPLSFWPSNFISLDLVKTVVIVLGTLIPCAFYAILAFRQRRLALPPALVFWPALLLAAAIVVSSLASGEIGKSFFGQGFEIGTASFLLILVSSGFVAYRVSLE